MVRAEFPAVIAEAVELPFDDRDAVADLHVGLEDLVLPDLDALRRYAADHHGVVTGAAAAAPAADG